MDALIYEELGAASRPGPLSKPVFACLQTPNMQSQQKYFFSFGQIITIIYFLN